MLATTEKYQLFAAKVIEGPHSRKCAFSFVLSHAFFKYLHCSRSTDFDSLPELGPLQRRLKSETDHRFRYNMMMTTNIAQNVEWKLV